MSGFFNALCGVALLAGAAAADAAVVSLDFSGVAPEFGLTTVDQFYSGGTSGEGVTGPDLGIAFSSNAFVANAYAGCCEPDDPVPGVLFFGIEAVGFIDYAAGFTTGFSLNYTTSVPVTITVHDGLGGAGNVLATLSLAPQFDERPCPTDVDGPFCTWTAAGVAFDSVARSVRFVAPADSGGYDNVTFGSVTPGAVPEPAAWALMIAGFGLVGGALRRRAMTLVAA